MSKCTGQTNGRRLKCSRNPDSFAAGKKKFTTTTNMEQSNRKCDIFGSWSWSSCQTLLNAMYLRWTNFREVFSLVPYLGRLEKNVFGFCSEESRKEIRNSCEVRVTLFDIISYRCVANFSFFREKRVLIRSFKVVCCYFRGEGYLHILSHQIFDQLSSACKSPLVSSSSSVQKQYPRIGRLRFCKWWLEMRWRLSTSNKHWLWRHGQGTILFLTTLHSQCVCVSLSLSFSSSSLKWQPAMPAAVGWIVGSGSGMAFEVWFWWRMQSPPLI